MLLHLPISAQLTSFTRTNLQFRALWFFSRVCWPAAWRRTYVQSVRSLPRPVRSRNWLLWNHRKNFLRKIRECSWNLRVNLIRMFWCIYTDFRRVVVDTFSWIFSGELQCLKVTKFLKFTFLHFFGLLAFFENKSARLIFKHSDWKEETGLCLVFCFVQILRFVTYSERLLIYCKRSQRILFKISWPVFVYVRILKSAKLLNIVLENEQQRFERYCFT